jgi:hypothetical protein
MGKYYIKVLKWPKALQKVKIAYEQSKEWEKKNKKKQLSEITGDSVQCKISIFFII